jgi:type IV fimbrial biogenesis protein FimT
MKLAIPNDKKQAGFYLIEWLLSAAIIAILTLMGLMNYHGWWLSFRAAHLQQELRVSIQNSSLLAREFQHRVLLCGISERSDCDSDWTYGWHVIDSDTKHLLESHVLPGELSLLWKGSLNRPVAFRSDGRPDGVQGGWHCVHQGREFFHLVMNRVM